MAFSEKTGLFSTENISVSAPDGDYTGIRESGYDVFKCIYYGVAERFGKPSPVSGRSQAEYGPRCPQDGFLPVSMSEDCLHLNIFRPSDADLCPVLVYVHGGSYMRGSNSEKATAGQTLAKDHRVVVVRVNYRLGLFGFLDFFAYGENYSHNPGLEDVILALNFIKRNIKAFGGDPDNITLMGESAGGGITAALASHVEEDIFQKTILSSPVPAAFITRHQSVERSERFLAFAGFRHPRELNRFDAGFLAPLSKRFADSTGQGVSAFQPGIDGQVLKEYPIVRFAEKRVKPRPSLIGVTGDEMSILNFNAFARYWNIESFIESGLTLERQHFAEEMYSLYQEVFGETDGRTQLYSDAIVRLAAVWYAEAASAIQPTWFYRFDYATPLARRIGLRAFHTIDLYFIFGNLPKPLRHPFNLAIQKQIQRDIVQFLREDLLPWEKVDTNSVPARCYGRTESCGDALPKTIRDFWNTSAFKVNCHKPVDRR